MSDKEPRQPLSTDGRITEKGIAELRSRIGRKLDYLSRREPVTQETIDRFALGIGDLNPLWTDPVYAATTAHAGTVAPPAILFALTGADTGNGLPGVHGLYTGSTVEWNKQLRPGDDLISYGFPSVVEEKQSRFAGRAVLQGTDIVCNDASGNLIATLRHFQLRTERAEARSRGVSSGKAHRERTVYTESELNEIELGILREEVRGDEPRFASGVRPGDKLVPVLKGPITVTDEVAWLRTGFAGTLTGPFTYIGDFATVWRRRHPAGRMVTPWGYHDSPEAVHWDETIAQQSGAAGIFDIGPQRASWMLQPVTNWMGDDGFLCRASIRLQGFVLVGDTVTLAGAVEAVEPSEERPRVRISLTATTQHHEVVGTGTAEVLLPS